MSELEEVILTLIRKELDKRDDSREFIPLAQFCKTYDLHRSTVIRYEREGKLKAKRLGKKIFIQKIYDGL